MAGLSIDVGVDKLCSGCWNCTSEHTTRITKFAENLNNLKIKLQELQADRNDLRRKVVAAERQGMHRLDKVQWWFSRVDAVESEVNKLIGKCEADQANKRWWFKYKMGKKIACKLTKLNKLKDDKQFDEVAFPAIMVEARPRVPTVGLQLTFDKVWKHLTEDEKVGIIGIYGMGGVGKTTLMTQINNEFLKRQHGFDCVIWITVSSNARMEKIQDDIGKKIGCCSGDWDAKSLDEKAMFIFRVLKEHKFVLLLDDIWERIDISKLGIPFPDEENMSKVVFTTRSEFVCGKMEARKKIKVECLSWEEAWELFKKKVGEDALNSHPEIPKLAEDVCKECGGLPLALITIGRAMACMQRPQEWRNAIGVLRKSASEFSGMEEEVLSLLKFSYDNLGQIELKSCFLYGALFPEDYRVRETDLIDLWIGEGFLSGTADQAYCRGYDIIGTLVHLCLLERTRSKNADAVKMHDIIRDMALWIANESNVVQTGEDLTRAPEVGNWSLARRVSLMDNRMEKLVEAPQCPNLSTLLLRGNDLKMISQSIFEFMPALTVLDLSSNLRLKNLPSTIAGLVSLQYLNLEGTGIEQLPVQLGRLKRLKFLNLNSSYVETIPDEVISGLTSLQLAKLASYTSGVGEEKLLEKIERLEKLDYLDVTITQTPTFQGLTSCTKLQNCTQFLQLYDFNDLVLDMSSLATMKSLKLLSIGYGKLEHLTIDCISEGCAAQSHPDGTPNNIIYSKVCFQSITEVTLFFCDRLRDATWVVFAPNLRVLYIRECESIEDVICREKWEQFVRRVLQIPDLFGKLEFLYLNSLRNLNSIHWKTLQGLSLKKIEVFECNRLRKLPLNPDSAGGRQINIKAEQDWWNSLEWEDDDTRNAFLPSASFY